MFLRVVLCKLARVPATNRAMIISQRAELLRGIKGSEIRDREKMLKSSRCASNSTVSGAARDANGADLRGFRANSAENL